MRREKMGALRTIALGAVGLVLGSCASTYVAPPDAATATLVYRVQGPEEGPTGFYRATTNDCQDLTVLSGSREGPPESQIEAGQRTVIMTRIYTSTHRCYNVLSFTPEPGRTYTVIHTAAAPNRCGLDVMDETQREPADLRRLPVRGNCAF